MRNRAGYRIIPKREIQTHVQVLLLVSKFKEIHNKSRKIKQTLEIDQIHPHKMKITK